MYDRPDVIQLRDNLSRVAEAHPSLKNEAEQQRLRALVYAVVDDLRASGWPPERIIVALKEIAAESGLRASRAVLYERGPLSEGDTILLSMVGWCIERYFDGGERLNRTGSSRSGNA